MNTPPVTRGTTIEQFLETARREFTELRGVSVDSLLFVKEDVIIPHVSSGQQSHTGLQCRN
jgi:hypothetical protein